ncbi:MAG: hypothetical protein ACREVK_03780 [Gammaproteobacteria bacterium]
MKASAKEKEYDSLRAELLSLLERAYGAWRYGLIEIGAVAAALLAQAGLPNIENALQSERYRLGALAVLSLSATGIAVFESLLALRFERGADRIGSFLAVFHDDSDIQAHGIRSMGWHAFSRVEKVSPVAGKAPPRVTYVGKMCLIFVPVVWLYWILLVVVIEPGKLGCIYKCVFYLALAAQFIFLPWFLVRQTAKAQREPVRLTEEWYAIAQLSPAEVEKYLERWGRPANRGPTETAAGTPQPSDRAD